jgi:DNA-binding HxlR family transcriptional regulator
MLLISTVGRMKKNTPMTRTTRITATIVRLLGITADLPFVLESAYVFKGPIAIIRVSQLILGNLDMMEAGCSFSVLKARTAVFISLLSFALVWTVISTFTLFSAYTGSSAKDSLGPAELTHSLLTYSAPLAGIGWALTGLFTIHERWRFDKRSQIRNLFSRMGFAPEVYNLMVGMRGARSRASLLHNLDSPKHRLELSELTGIDWKEVDRQLCVLEKYGLVRVYAQSGIIKLYQVTEHGKLLIRLVNELSGESASQDACNLPPEETQKYALGAGG